MKMSKAKATLIGAVAPALLVATQFAAVAGETPDLRVANNNPTTITLTSQTPGPCGTWISSSGAKAPPATVAGSSTSAAFKLFVAPACLEINVAKFQYVGSNGVLEAECTYQIVGNTTFSYSASGATGCAVAVAGTGDVDFIFPNLGGSSGKRTVRTIHRM